MSLVYTAGASRKGGAGRYHTAPWCWTIPKGRRVIAAPLAAAAAAGKWACPYCCPPPPCCAQGQHATYSLPNLPRNDEAPDYATQQEASP